MSPTAPTFDGRLQARESAGATTPVRVQVVGRVVTVHGDGISRAVPLTGVTPQKRDDGSLVLGLGDGTEVVLTNGHDWEAHVGFVDEGSSSVATTVGAATGESVQASAGARLAPHRAAGRGSWVPLAVLAGLLVAVAVWLYAYAIPAAGGLLVGLVPSAVDTAIGDASFQAMDAAALQPSGLPAEQQNRLRTAFNRAVDRADGTRAAPTAIEFRRADMGPNAFALPGGRIVVTDDLVGLVDGREDAVVGVLGHEYGHVKARHGVRNVAQSALLATLMSAIFGDVSGLLAGAPQILGEQAYSRDFEREADAESVRVLRAGGYSPSAMVVFFNKLVEKKLATGRGLAIAFASHPADAERIQFFEQAGSTR
jgi:Zn-dependent protease with chaperone function